MLEIENSALVVVDVQGKLAQLMYNKEDLFKNIQILIKSAKILKLPIIWCQQVPKVLGPTLPEIAELLTDSQPINKASFSCYGDEKFTERLNSLGRKQVLLCGIETHVCIYQTAVDLINKNYQVALIADAVSSRTQQNKQIALSRLEKKGAEIYSTEMVLFELMKTAEHPNFKQIAKLVK